MKFYLGTHRPSWLARTDVPLFVSRRVMPKQRFPRALGPWALDSGGFTELSTYGEWRMTEAEYIRAVKRYENEVGNLEWVAPQDWMCEPDIIAGNVALGWPGTKLSVEEHQRRTILNFEQLRYALGNRVIPVLQGWEPDDYLRHWNMYERFYFSLETEPLVGLGSVCRRQDMAIAERIVRSLSPLRLHGFGVKIDGLAMYGDALVSADSLAWSFGASRRARESEAPRLFSVSRRRGECGALLQTPEHPAKSCANCFDWAMQWRDQIAREEIAA